MKKQEFQQLKSRSHEELQKELKDYNEKLRNLKFDLAAGKVKNVREIRAIKKIIACIITIVNEK